MAESNHSIQAIQNEVVRRLHASGPKLTKQKQSMIKDFCILLAYDEVVAGVKLHKVAKAQKLYDLYMRHVDNFCKRSDMPAWATREALVHTDVNLKKPVRLGPPRRQQEQERTPV